ncbi:MAG: FAD-dependent oxidoreductase [Cyanobacteria bacterium P01_A01_bin.114]
MSTEYDYELVVIGAGSGGLAAAKQAAKQGKRVAIAEKEAIGGTCVNRGCIPTKLMIYAADFAKQQTLASDYGWVNPEGLFDWPTFKQAMDAHIESLRQTQADHLDGIDILRGQAEFVDTHTLRIADQKVTAEFVLIAVGARPRMPDIPGIEHALTSRDIFQLETLPESFVVAGGGYIGVEFSQVLRSFGCQITLIDSSDHVLDRFDEAVQKRVKQILTDDGIKVIDGTRLEAIEKGADTLIAKLDNGQTFKTDQILCALGRTGNIDTLNLEAAGVTFKKSKIVVDEYGRTQTPHIFAVGDCTDKMLLTPVARAEALAAVETMFSDHSAQVSYRWVPSAVFMHPEVAMVGLTERAARDRYDQVEIHSETFSPLKYALAEESLKSLIKLVVDPNTQTILGVHLVAPRAADLVQALVPALKKGLTVAELEQTIGIHPSVGEEIFAL